MCCDRASAPSLPAPVLIPLVTNPTKATTKQYMGILYYLSEREKRASTGAKYMGTHAACMYVSHTFETGKRICHIEANSPPARLQIAGLVPEQV